jgi:hypothetical protein
MQAKRTEKLIMNKREVKEVTFFCGILGMEMIIFATFCKFSTDF